MEAIPGDPHFEAGPSTLTSAKKAGKGLKNYEITAAGEEALKSKVRNYRARSIRLLVVQSRVTAAARRTSQCTQGTQAVIANGARIEARLRTYCALLRRFSAPR